MAANIVMTSDDSLSVFDEEQRKPSFRDSDKISNVQKPLLM